MNVERYTVPSGPANGKNVIRVKTLDEDKGSFQVIRTALYGCGATMYYIVHGKYNGTKLCSTLQEIAIHLGIDYDNFIEALYACPEWDVE